MLPVSGDRHPALLYSSGGDRYQAIAPAILNPPRQSSGRSGILSGSDFSGRNSFRFSPPKERPSWLLGITWEEAKMEREALGRGSRLPESCGRPIFLEPSPIPPCFSP